MIFENVGYTVMINQVAQTQAWQLAGMTPLHSAFNAPTKEVIRYFHIQNASSI